MKRYICIASILFLLGTGCQKHTPREISIIPEPVQVKPGDDSFFLGRKTRIITPPDRNSEQIAQYFRDWVKHAAGLNMEVSTDSSDAGRNTIVLIKVINNRTLGDEGYFLNVERKRITIGANSSAGLFYGVQTLLQLSPPEVFSGRPGAVRDWDIPCCRITDYPRFRWRGMHLDVSRHFFPVDFIKSYIDLIAMHKMNIFHWHLTDDNGWRIEIIKYPKLTEVAAWRVDREDQPWRQRTPPGPGEKATYGGFYTQDEIRNIVAYAAKRHVEVIPEIEMPGHTSEVFAAYPEYSCRGEKLYVQPGSYWPNEDIFCAGKEETFQFLDDVLTEVAQLFPSDYIHIGGDEANKSRWEKCPLCQKRIRTEELEDEKELQSYFIRRIEKILKEKGKKLIGWDEILEGGLAPGATVMSWRGFEGGIEAARQSRPVIMCPTSHCYFDYYQADPEFEPEAIGGLTTLRKVYSFDPVPEELRGARARHVMGGQGNLWTEFIDTPEHAEYMALPRMTALAEALWTPLKNKDWDDFRQRLEMQFARFDAMDVNYSDGSWKVTFKPHWTQDGKFGIKLQTEQLNPGVYYTLDGSDPSPQSLKYESPILIDSGITIRAAIFQNGQLMERISEKNILYHRAVGKSAVLTNPPAERYDPGGAPALVDGITGSFDFRDGCWLGFHGDDMEMEIDLGKVVPVEQITASFLQHTSSWIFMPEQVHFRLFDTEKRPVGHVTALPETTSEAIGAVKEPLSARFSDKSARYVTVTARNMGTCPEWHEGAGHKAWIFADEVIVK